MDEFLSEQEQWDRLKAWLRENVPWLILGVALAGLGLWGWRFWEAREERLAIEASSRYEQMLEALERGDRTRALAIAGELERDYGSSPYADQAQLVAAKSFVLANELDEAAQRLGKVMRESPDEELRLVARLRLARVQLAQGKHDAALETLGAVKPGAFAPAYAEARGDAHLAKGDREAALREYRAARAAGAEGVVDPELLDLKINDLATTAAAAGPGVAASAK